MNNNSLFECSLCTSNKCFKNSQLFVAHLRNSHCTKEGGSFVCSYGPHDVCKYLPLEGVSDKDYEEHVKRIHVQQEMHRRSSSGENPPPSTSLSCSTPPSLVKDTSQQWTIFNSTQNLAAVLNDPRKTRREVTSFFTRHWGEAFTERQDIPPNLHIPKITWKHFEEYTSKISHRQRRSIRESKIRTKFGKSSSPDSSYSSSYTKTRVGDVVPAMFFSSKFSLEDHQCFEALFLTENLEVVPENVPDLHNVSAAARREARLKPNKIMQEKLSYYLDAVEIQISRHISSQSESFFRAMTSHDELQTSLEQTKMAVRKLRFNIGNLDERLALRSLHILRLQTTRSNHDSVLKKLELMATVKQTQSMVQTLLHSSDYLGALELIATTQTVLKDELNGVICFRHLSAQLSELESLIRKMLQEEFIKIIKMELGRPISNDFLTNMDETSLVTIILGLLRVREYRFFTIFDDQCSNCVKNLIRDTIRSKLVFDDSSTSTDFDSSTGSLADQMRKLAFQQWFELLQHLTNTLLLLLKKIKIIVDISTDLIEMSYGNGKSVSTDKLSHIHSSFAVDFVDVLLNESDYANLMENAKDFVLKLCTYAQERCVRVLVARSKDGFLEKLSIEEFLSIQQSVEEFSLACDELAGRRIFSLRSSLQNQTLKLVDKFNDDRKTKLGRILDQEHWKQADVPLMFQEIVDNFEKTGKLRDVLEKNTKLTHPYLLLNGEKFVTVGTGLIVVQMIAQYCQFMEKMTDFSGQILNHLLDILTNFNSRICQLIYGGGAMQLVGIKKIGARVVALASRCIQLVAYFIPTIRRYFEIYFLPANQNNHDRIDKLNKRLIKIEKDYQNHIDEMFKVLLDIMENQISACFQKWELKPPVPSQPFQHFVKNMKRFFTAISDVLPNLQLQKLFLRIHDKFKVHLRVQLKQWKITPHDGALYNLVCSEFSYYMENLKSLPSCSAIDDSLQEVLIER